MKIISLSNATSLADDVARIAKFSSAMPISSTLAELASLVNNSGVDWALCGGLAVGIHARPRGTEDIDIVLRDDSEIEQFMWLARTKFKRTRAHAMTHSYTGVEVELVTPQFVKIDPAIANMAIDTAIIHPFGKTQVRVVNREALIAMKLCRGDDYDRGDIKAIIKSGGDVDLSSWLLDDKAKTLLESIRMELQTNSGIQDTP